MINKQHEWYRKNDAERFSNMKMNLANLRHEPNQKNYFLQQLKIKATSNMLVMAFILVHVPDDVNFAFIH